jgi:hypothetical protein
MRTAGLLIVALVSFVPWARGQVLRTSEVLATARQDLRVQQTEQLALETSSLRFHDPWLKGVEARVGIRGSTLGDTIYGYIRNEDLYGLQITTNSFREIKRQKAYKTAQVNAFTAEKTVFLEEALLARYEALAGLHYAGMQVEALEMRAALLQKKQELLRLSAEKGFEIRVKEVVSTEEDRLKTANSLMEARQQYKLWEAKIRQFLDTEQPISIDTSDFISIRKIAQFAQLPATAAAPPEIAWRERVSDLEQARHLYLHSQNRQIFNSIRVNYDDPLYLTRPNRFNTFNNFSVRVGLTLPMPGNNNYSSSRAMISWREAQLSAQRAAQQYDTQGALQREHLAGLLQFYENLELQQAQSLIPGLLANEALRAVLSPMELVELEITQQQLTLRTLETARDATFSYIRLLNLSGLLVQAPPVNWLSERGEGW